MRGEAGFVSVQRDGPIDAVSIAVWYRKGSTDRANLGNFGGLTYVSPTINLGADTDSPLPDVESVANQDFRLYDVQFRLKHAPAEAPWLTVNVEPFFAHIAQDVSAGVRDLSTTPPMPIVNRRASLTGNSYGTQFAIEGRHVLTDSLTMRGRASLGVYHTRVNGDFAFGVGGTPAGSHALARSLNGFRAGAEIGAEYRLTSTLSLGVTAGIDHNWSSMPFPRLSTGAQREPI